MKLANITTGTLNELRYHYGNGSEVEIFSEGDSEVYSALEEDADTEMLEHDEMWTGCFTFMGYNYAIMGAGSLTSSGEYILGRIIEDETVENNVNLFDDKNDITKQPICESEKSDKVVEFKNLNEFTLEFQKLFVSGEVWGVYSNEKGKLVCKTQSGEIIKHILR